MAIILCIDTATDICSVAVSRNGQVEGYSAAEAVNSHAENINLLIDKSLKLSNTSFQQLDAIAVSMGPGSYTSLRVGAATVKAIAMTLDIPVIGIGTLVQLAHSVKDDDHKADYIIPMIDARRMEVYTSTYNGAMELIDAPQSLVLDAGSYESFHNSKVLFVGNGANKMEQLTNSETWNIRSIANTADQLVPMVEAYYQKKLFISAIKFTPLYLKSPNITQSKKELF